MVKWLVTILSHLVLNHLQIMNEIDFIVLLNPLKKKETLNLGADSKFKKFLIGGFHLSGDVIKISNDEKNRILSLGKFKNPISVDINYAYSRKASSEAVMLLTAQIILFPIEVGAAAATVLTMPVWVPAFCVFSKCSN